jgi:hypothetical protein
MSVARNGKPCDCETPGDWHRVANDFQRAMFRERERAEKLTEILRLMNIKEHRNQLIDKLEDVDRQLSIAIPRSFTHYDLSRHAETLATEIDRLAKEI